VSDDYAALPGEPTATPRLNHQTMGWLIASAPLSFLLPLLGVWTGHTTLLVASCVLLVALVVGYGQLVRWDRLWYPMAEAPQRDSFWCLRQRPELRRQANVSVVTWAVLVLLAFG
jgi:hypothetical protein